MGVCEKVFNAICPQKTNPTDAAPNPNPTAKIQPVASQQPALGITEPVKTLAGHRHDQVTRDAPTNEVVVTHVNADVDQLQAVVRSGNGKVTKASSRREAEPPVLLVMANPSNGVTAHGHGQGLKVTSRVEPEKPHVRVQGNREIEAEDESPNLGTDHVEDNFSDYINRAKMKIGTTRHVVREKKVTRLDSFSDKVSNYINHAKIKFRTPTFK